MILIKMRPSQIADAVEQNLPVLMAAGVVEYHGPHLPIGTDFLMANCVCEEIEKRCECVLAPALTYGPTLSWAGGSGEGEMDFSPEAFYVYAREALNRLLKIGFRRIYVLQFHQGDEGLQSLCLRKAAAELVRDITGKWEEGWGRKNNRQWPEKNIFNIIKIASLDTFSNFPENLHCCLDFSHAGKGETQFVMAGYPDTVDLKALMGVSEEMAEWLGDAKEADAEEGKRWIEYCVRGWVREFSEKYY